MNVGGLVVVVVGGGKSIISLFQVAVDNYIFFLFNF